MSGFPEPLELPEPDNPSSPLPEEDAEPLAVEQGNAAVAMRAGTAIQLRSGGGVEVRFLGVDLAWREGSAGNPASETGVAAIDPDGRILHAGWIHGVEQTIAWAEQASGEGSALMFVDASLVVRNETEQRLCETQAGQRYGRWKVSASTTNLRSPRLAGVRFLSVARHSGWRCSDGSHGPPSGPSYRRFTPMRRWWVPRSLAIPVSGHGTSASRAGLLPASGEPSALRHATC
jgi:Protein of unknown function (DUF429)